MSMVIRVIVDDIWLKGRRMLLTAGSGFLAGFRP